MRNLWGNAGFYRDAPLFFIKWKVKKSSPGNKKQFYSPLTQDWSNQVFFPLPFPELSPLQPMPVMLVCSRPLCALHTLGWLFLGGLRGQQERGHLWWCPHCSMRWSCEKQEGSPQMPPSMWRCIPGGSRGQPRGTGGWNEQVLGV